MLDVHVIPVTPLQQNCSLLVCTETQQAVVVDPGGEVPKILAKAAELAVEPAEIWITHCHFDHVGGVAELAKALRIPVLGSHQHDEPLIAAMPEFAAMFGVEAPETFVPDRWLAQGDQLTVGEQQFDVSFCPGHAPGHVVFHCKEQKIAITGDVLFDQGVGRTDLPLSNHDALMRSLKNHILTMDDDTIFMPGHGPSSTIGQQRRVNPFLVSLT